MREQGGLGVLPKAEDERVDAKVLISVSLPLRRKIERAAMAERISMSEIGRRALQSYFSPGKGDGK